ncbi:MAG: hypothetical protein KC456_02015 [Flavobacteriales bacterium]|jgi:hypothetical protein|nr:hypothetical protein [Flavobacteriales bacterium]
MHSNYILFPILSIVLLFGSCNEPEPFEYPEDPIEVEPAWITETERVVSTEELWKAVQLSDGCDPNLHVSNLAFYELNYTRGFASIQLLPSDSACQVEVGLRTKFNSGELSTHEWDELHFEFTYSEYSGQPSTEYWIDLNYKGLELNLNLAPVIASLVPFDTTDGLFKLHFENDKPVFELNGKTFSPDFTEGTGNHFEAHGDGTEDYFEARMTSTDTELHSYTIFQYLRFSRFGLKDD